MSDCAAKRFGKKKEFQILSRQSDLGFSFELTKARLSERLMLGVTSAGASAGNTQHFSSKMWGITHNICQGVEAKNADQAGRPFESSMMQKKLNLYAANTVVSERFSFHKISDISVNSHKVLSLDNLSLEWNHFPMFEINRKIDSILNPRHSAFGTSPDKSSVPQKDLKLNISTSNVMSFSKEYQFHSHQITDENMSKCRSAAGILPHLDKHIGLNFDHAGKKLKGHLSIEESCSRSKNETNSSCSLTDNHCANNFFVNSKETPLWSTENNLMFSASTKENKHAEGTLLEMKLGTAGGCPKQQHSERVAHGQVLGRECEMQPVNASTNSKGNDVGTNSRGMVFANLLPSEHENLRTHRVNSTMKLTESCDLYGKIKNKVPKKSKGETLALGKPPKGILTDGKRKAPCLFEMLTRPSKSQTTYFNDPMSLSSCSLGAQKQFVTKTDTLYNGTHLASGFASSSTQKESDCPNMAKSELIATSSVQGVSTCSGENETLNVSAGNYKSCPKETCTNNQEWSISKTSNTNLDLVLFQINRMRNPISSALIESPVCLESSDKWLKCLQHDILDRCLPCSKRSKIGDGLPPEGACTVFGQEMINHAKEVQLGYGRLINPKNLEGSLISAKCLNRWIGRWCQGSNPISHGASNVEKQTLRFNIPPDDLEGQFPSIAAMAMMGRAMNKLQPCELQKRGPSVVWKTQGL